MPVVGTLSFLIWKQMFASRKCFWNISLICSLLIFLFFQLWLSVLVLLPICLCFPSYYPFLCFFFSTFWKVYHLFKIRFISHFRKVFSRSTRKKQKAITIFSLISLRLLMIFFLCVQLPFSPSCFLSVSVSFSFYELFPNAWPNSYSLFANRAPHAYRKLHADEWSFLTGLDVDRQGRFLGEPPISVPSGLFSWVADTPQGRLCWSLAWRRVCVLLPVFCGEGLRPQHWVRCQYGRSPLCSLSQEFLLHPFRYKPLAYCWCRGGPGIRGSNSFGWCFYFLPQLHSRRTWHS